MLIPLAGGAGAWVREADGRLEPGTLGKGILTEGGPTVVLVPVGSSGVECLGPAIKPPPLGVVKGKLEVVLRAVADSEGAPLLCAAVLPRDAPRPSPSPSVGVTVEPGPVLILGTWLESEPGSMPPDCPSTPPGLI